MLREDGGRHELRHVALGLGLQHAPPGHGPEVLLPGALRARDLSWSGVVGGPGHPPVAELLVQLLQVARRRARRLLRVAALVDPEVLVEAHHLPGGGHELPGADRARDAHGHVREAALDHRQVDGVLRQPLLPHDLAVARDVGVRAREPADEVGADVRRLEEADVGDDGVVHLDRDVVLGLESLEIVVDLRQPRDRLGGVIAAPEVAPQRVPEPQPQRGLEAEARGLCRGAVSWTEVVEEVSVRLGAPEVAQLGGLRLDLLLDLLGVGRVRGGLLVGRDRPRDRRLRSRGLVGRAWREHRLGERLTARRNRLGRELGAAHESGSVRPPAQDEHGDDDWERLVPCHPALMAANPDRETLRSRWGKSIVQVPRVCTKAPDTHTRRARPAPCYVTRAP